MNWDYEKEFRRVVFVAAIYIASAIPVIVIAELIRAGIIPLSIQDMAWTEDITVLRVVFGGIAAALLILAFLIKSAIRRTPKGTILRIFKAWIRNNHRSSRSSAVAILIPPTAMCEFSIVLGFVLFILSGGSRIDFYPFVIAALVAMIILFPRQSEKEVLVKLDKEVQ